MTTLTSLLLLLPLLLLCYIRSNDQKLSRIPQRALDFSPNRVDDDLEDISRTAQRLAKDPPSVDTQLPPKTGRRYIVVGGTGFLGGWIVLHLLRRGESPCNIRVLDIRLPSRQDLLTGPAKDVDFLLVDISDADAVSRAFSAAWPEGVSSEDVTVFHTASNIRFYERSPSLLPYSTKVNVQGTINIINASRAIGASALVYTSSGSISIRSSRFLLFPWEQEPEGFVQFIDDNDSIIPKHHQDFFSNYAVTKSQAERLIRDANGSRGKAGRVFKTGAIRPGNGVFGPGGDVNCYAYLVRKNNPSWAGSIVQNFVYVENASLAHLLYERSLISQSSNPDLGGQAFTIADPGAPPTYGDVYTTLSTLTAGETTFPHVSPTLLLLISYIFEAYYLARFFLLSSTSKLLSFIGSKLPPLGTTLVNLQPSLFSLVSVHLIFDDSRARLDPLQGGLGYKGAWTTLEALHATVDAYMREKETPTSGSDRSKGAGISIELFGFLKRGKEVRRAKGARDGFRLQVVN